MSRIKELEHCRIRAADDATGTVADTYFDDTHWVVRYLAAEVGGWLHKRKVLHLPRVVKSLHPSSRTISTDLSRSQIQTQTCPSIDRHQPVSRQHEYDFQPYEGSQYGYRGSGVMPALTPSPGVEAKMALRGQHAAEIPLRRRHSRSSAADPHLRSSREVIGYHIEATDGALRTSSSRRAPGPLRGAHPDLAAEEARAHPHETQTQE